jgi:hypothetical protein
MKISFRFQKDEEAVIKLYRLLEQHMPSRYA